MIEDEVIGQRYVGEDQWRKLIDGWRDVGACEDRGSEVVLLLLLPSN